VQRQTFRIGYTVASPTATTPVFAAPGIDQFSRHAIPVAQTGAYAGVEAGAPAST
jgi:hypothetical protein